MLLSDLIAGKENSWATLYDSTRAAPLTFAHLYQVGLEEAVHFFKDRVTGSEAKEIPDVGPGEDGIIGKRDNQSAVYLHASGVYRQVKPSGEELGLPLPRLSLLG